MSDTHMPNVQHHFRDIAHQHDAAKLGIWLFLATEILLFGGLFCGYAVFRANHPDLFAWGEQFLDERYGALNTAVLLISSLTMAMAITFVQREQKNRAMVSLFITFLCACGFMFIKSIEYEHKFHDHLVGGIGFYQVSHHEGGDEGGHVVLGSHGDTIKGKKLWDATCRSCHGASGEGVPGQGTVLNSSTYVHDHTDHELVEFIMVGREATSPDTVLYLQMPPKGGNPMLKEADILDIVAYMRTLEIAPVAVDQATHAVVESIPIAEDEGDFLSSLPRSTVPHATPSPQGLAPQGAAEAQKMAVYVRPEVPQTDEHRPANAHLFFGLYFLMTGLHGIHVLIGMVVIGWLMWRLQRGDFNRQYYAPVECGGLYWHIVDVIWIFLFPLWYLIA
jgi:cytochrome c oxidase subunit 3